jgi:hypothetical protein
VSGKLIGAVYKYELGHSEQAVLIAMAENGRDDGTSVRPSPDLIAWKLSKDQAELQKTVARALAAQLTNA